MPRRPPWWTLPVLVLIHAACGGGSDSVQTPSPSVRVTRVSGDAQTAPVASALQPYVAQVLDQSGQPSAGVAVTWSVTSGGGTVTPANDTTGGDGMVSAIATLGTSVGPQAVLVRLKGGSASATFLSAGVAGAPSQILKGAGDGQNAVPGALLPGALSVELTDQHGNPCRGVTVVWTAIGGGAPSSPSTVTNSSGVTQVTWRLGGGAAPQQLQAAVTGLTPVSFTATAISSFTIVGGGNNVSERFGSDLWLADGYGYSGTWYGPRVNGGSSGNAVKIWRLSASGAPTLVDSIVTPTILDVSDLGVSPDGHWLVFTAEGGADAGALVYELTAPGTAVFRAKYHASAGYHTGSLADIGGSLYLFAAENDGGNGPALAILSLSQAASGTITSVSRTSVPANYGLHDTFVRDGICFAFVWNEGVYIYDVGNGVAGGSVQAPALVGNVKIAGGAAHNGWWFWNPTNGERRYLFVGQEGPLVVGAASSGDIHVVDVSNLAAPVEVASFRLPGAGAHNFWMDEANQRLYAAFYNGGVVALDMSGTLSGDLSTRKIAQIRPGGAGNTFVWGVMLYNGSLYANDMLSGFWQLGLP